MQVRAGFKGARASKVMYIDTYTRGAGVFKNPRVLFKRSLIYLHKHAQASVHMQSKAGLARGALARVEALTALSIRPGSGKHASPAPRHLAPAFKRMHQSPGLVTASAH